MRMPLPALFFSLVLILLLKQSAESALVAIKHGRLKVGIHLVEVVLQMIQKLSYIY